MKPKIKTILIIFLVLVSVFSIFYLLSLSKNKQKSPAIIPPKPALVQNYKGKFPITLSVDQSQFNFPDKLPFLELESASPQLDEARARGIATGLNFSGEPMKIEDSLDGTTYFWKNDTGTLFVYLKSRKIRYSTGAFAPGINKQLSDETILTTAREFVVKKELLDENLFQANSVTFLEQVPGGEGFRETKKASAVLYLVDILPETTKYGFVSISSVDPASYVQLKQDGSVYSLQLILFPSLKTGATEYKLKDYNELKSSLGGAILIEIGGGTALLADLPADSIQSIDVNKIEIAYLIESPKAASFQPVYKLSGEATLKNSNKEAVATLYLPAISEN